jgi:hypothetical protein
LARGVVRPLAGVERHPERYKFVKKTEKISEKLGEISRKKSAKQGKDIF